MNARNALGFLAIGAAMWFLPRLAPGLISTDGYDATSDRAIWTELMGLIQALLGSTYLFKHYVLVPGLRLATAYRFRRRSAEVMLPGAQRADLL
jgi:hypothetical protein